MRRKIFSVYIIIASWEQAIHCCTLNVFFSNLGKFFGAEKRIVEDIAGGLLYSNVRKSFELVQMRELR